MQRPKFAVQTKIMDFTSKIRDIINAVSCERHSAQVGRPCWWIQGDGSLTLYAGVCNHRAKKRYNGKISDFANRTNKHPKKEHRP